MPRYWIDWKLEGTFECEADTADEAEELFDKRWNTPKGVMPLRDGELWQSRPLTGAEKP